MHGHDQLAHVPDREEAVGGGEVDQVDAGSRHGPAHGQHVAQPSPSLGRCRPARGLAHVDHDPIESLGDLDRRRRRSIDEDQELMVSRLTRRVPRVSRRANRPNPRRLDRQLPSIPIRMSASRHGEYSACQDRLAGDLDHGSSGPTCVGGPSCASPVLGDRVVAATVRSPRSGRPGAIRGRSIASGPLRSRPRSRSSNNTAGGAAGPPARRQSRGVGRRTRITAGSRRRSPPVPSPRRPPPRG